MNTENLSKSYELPSESLPTLDYSCHLADLIKFKEFVETRGVSTKNTRIDRYIQCLNEVVSKKHVNEPSIFKNSREKRFRSSLDWQLYVLREVHELTWILKGLTKHIPQGIDDKLKQLVGGSDFAALDENTHSRNVQFELRIASYFCQTGCSVNLSTETDIIALHGNFAFFLECKRVASKAQLRHRLSEALKQLRCRMPQSYQERRAYGCIVLDVTRVAFEHNGLTIAVTPEHSKDINQDKLKSIAGSVSNAVATSGVDNFIRCWFQIHIASLIANPPCVSSRFSSYSIDDFAVRKDSLPALILLRVISAVGEIPDGRENPAQKLKRRTGVHLPAGSTFRPVELSIAKELQETGCVKANRTDEVIAMLEFDGVKHEFSIRDLLCFFAVATASDKEDMVKEDMRARIVLLLKMFMIRYPYENVSTPSFGLPLDIDRPD